MVFGWGKKKQEKPEVKEAQLEKVIPLFDVKQTTDGIKELREKTLVAETRSFKNKIDDNLSNLLKIANKLEKDDLNVDDIDKHLRTVVVRGKRQVISIIKKGTSKKLGRINSYEDVIQFDKEISQILKMIGDALGRQTRVIHIFAKKYANKLKDIMSMLDSDAKEVNTLLENQKKLHEKITLISDDLDKIDQLTAIQKNNENRLDELNESLNLLEKKIESTKHEIEQLKSSAEYSKFLEINRSIDELESEKSQIKNEIDLQFTKISRPLSKYGYITSLEKEQKILLEKLTKDPIEVLTQTNKDNVIIILQAARKGIESGSVSVKDADKSVSQIDETTEMLDDFIKKVSVFESKKSNLNKELQTFDVDKLHRKENELSKLESEKDDTKSRIETIKNEILDVKKQIPQTIMNIESMLQVVSSTRYKITQ